MGLARRGSTSAARQGFARPHEEFALAHGFKVAMLVNLIGAGRGVGWCHFLSRKRQS